MPSRFFGIPTYRLRDHRKSFFALRSDLGANSTAVAVERLDGRPLLTSAPRFAPSPYSALGSFDVMRRSGACEPNGVGVPTCRFGGAMQLYAQPSAASSDGNSKLRLDHIMTSGRALALDDNAQYVDLRRDRDERCESFDVESLSNPTKRQRLDHSERHAANMEDCSAEFDHSGGLGFGGKGTKSSRYRGVSFDKKSGANRFPQCHSSSLVCGAQLETTRGQASRTVATVTLWCAYNRTEALASHTWKAQLVQACGVPTSGSTTTAKIWGTLRRKKTRRVHSTGAHDKSAAPRTFQRTVKSTRRR